MKLDNYGDSDDNTDISSANEHANDELSEQDDMDVAKERENDNKEVTIEIENKAIPDNENNEKKTDVDIEATVNVQVENVQKTEASKETIEKTAIDVKTIKEIHTFDTLDIP